MKQLIAFFFVIVLNTISCSLHSGENAKTKVNWTTSYEEAVDKAKATSKPIILFFTGSDWCGWCNKLEDEVFNSQEFSEASGDKYIFVKLDFPLYTPLTPKISAQNKQLQKKYDVRSFPTLIVLDSQEQQQIGVTGYRPGGGKQYALHLQKMVSDFTAYREKIQNLPKQKLSGADLRKLYEKSKELDLANDTNTILKIGLESDEKLFFLTERYRFLADEGMIHNPEAVALRQQLLAIDPDNKKHIHYDISVIEFEALSEETQKENYSPEQVVAPLSDYVSKFGSKDKDNLWRLEMIISQVYLDKNKLAEAIQHAQASHDAAPSSVQAEIASAIKSMQTQLNAKH